MMNLVSLEQVIRDSSLSDESKEDWLGLLPRMTEEQLERLEETLVKKTKLVSAMAALDEALKIIDDTEAEVLAEEEELERAREQEVAAGDPVVAPDMAGATDTSTTSETMASADNTSLPSKSELLSEQQDSQAKLAQLRAELKQISSEVTTGQ